MYSEEKTTRKTAKRFKRRQWVVDPRLQWKFCGTVGLSVFIATAMMSSILFVVLYDHARTRVIDPGASMVSMGILVLVVAVTFAALTSCALGLWSLLFTHRICGPLYVVRSYFTELANGSIPTPRPLRKKDELVGFYAEFTRMTESLRAKKQQDYEAISRALNEASSADLDDLTSCQQAIDRILSEIEPLKVTIALALEMPAEPKKTHQGAKQRELACAS